MADIFISHSAADKELANFLCNSFEARGLSCWIAPRDIVPGAEWAESITGAIADCSVLLVIYSKNSMRSSQVAKEIGMADRKSKYIVPYKIDDTEPEGSFDYYLSCCQWVVAQPENDDYKIDELCDAIENVVIKKNPVRPAQVKTEPVEIKEVPKEVPVKVVKKPSEKKKNTPAQRERRRLMFGICAVAVVIISLVTGIVLALISGSKDGKEPDIANSGNIFDTLFTKEEDMFEYEVQEGNVTITGYIGTDSEVVIPDTLEGEPVKSLGNKIFYGRTDITSVVIPEGITEVPPYAFYKCSNLTSVTIPDGVVTIGVHAFEECTSLTEITLPDSVTKVDDFAFNKCSNLTKINLSASLESIGMYSFATCTSLYTVTLSEQLTSIGDMAFAYCTSLTEIYIPSKLQQYPENVFIGCEQINIKY